MILNPDCIRDVLLYLEENLVIDYKSSTFKFITLFQLTQGMIERHSTQYTEEDIWYSVYNLVSIQYIEGVFRDVGNEKMSICEIHNISYNGHQFLNNIRPDTVWQATKKGASKLGIMSIHALSTISMKLVEAVISNPQVIAKIVELL